MPPRMPAGYDVVTFDTIDSTMDEARRQAAQGITGPLWIMAAQQTKGRGRRNRVWTSSAGNLFCTLLINPGVAPAEAASLSFLSALCVGETLDHFLSNTRQISYKWPNDVLLDGRKVAGILLEAVSDSAARLSWVAIGIGINLAQHPQDTPWPATNLTVAGVQAPLAQDALEVLADRFEHWLGYWKRDGFAPIKAAWLARAARIGQPIEVRLDKETLTGIFTALDESGALVLTLADNTTRLISAGDVFFPEK